MLHISRSIKGRDRLGKELKGQCPCGHSFEILGSKDEAISMVKLHVESSHKDLLPFGITNDEAQTLLNEGHKEIKPKSSVRTAFSVQTESASSFTSQSLLDKLLGEDIEVEHTRTKSKKAQLIA